MLVHPVAEEFLVLDLGPKDLGEHGVGGRERVLGELRAVPAQPMTGEQPRRRDHDRRAGRQVLNTGGQRSEVIVGRQGASDPVTISQLHRRRPDPRALLFVQALPVRAGQLRQPPDRHCRTGRDRKVRGLGYPPHCTNRVGISQPVCAYRVAIRRNWPHRDAPLHTGECGLQQVVLTSDDRAGLAGFKQRFNQHSAQVQSLIAGTATGVDRDIAEILDAAGTAVEQATQSLEIASAGCKSYADQI